MIRRDFLASLSALAATGATYKAHGGQPCTPAPFTIDGGAIPASSCVQATGTSLSDLAASMSIGSWAKLQAGGQDAALGVGPISGSMIHYCNSMPWNPLDKCIEIIGMDHNAVSQRYVRYVGSSGAFQVMASETGAGNGTRHGYDHSAVNPFTGDLYHRIAENDSPTGIKVVRKLRSASSLVAIQSVSKLFYAQIATGACWWSGAFSGAGNQGCLLIFNGGDSAIGGSAEDGGMYAYDPLTASWFWTSRSMAPGYGSSGNSYHAVLEYSPQFNCAVYGGGNDSPRKLWRMDADRSVHRLTDVPSGKAVGIQKGVFTVEPVTGKYLLLSAGELWELDPSGAGTWKQLSGNRAPPSAVGIPGPNETAGVICSSISTYGVVAYVTQTSSNGGVMHIYKHA